MQNILNENSNAGKNPRQCKVKPYTDKQISLLRGSFTRIAKLNGLQKGIYVSQIANGKRNIKSKLSIKIKADLDNLLESIESIEAKHTTNKNPDTDA